MEDDPVILAIAPKSKRLGVAIFCGKRLIYYQRAGLLSRGINESTNACRIIQKLIKSYKPEILVIEKLIYPQQKTEPIIRLCQRIIEVAELNNLKVKSYSPKEVRLHFCQRDEPSKEHLARQLICHFPELEKYQTGQSKRQRQYGMLIFSAIALGLYCAVKINKLSNKN
jgi:Holliday junction resolvasome RuvABC endonuclease subunit